MYDPIKDIVFYYVYEPCLHTSELGYLQYVLKSAVKGMLPKSKLGAKLLKKLRVYADEKHPHQGQSPKPLVV